MNFNLKSLLLLCISITLPLSALVTTIPAKLAISHPLEKGDPAPIPAKLPPCTKKAQIPYEQQFKTAALPITQRELYVAIWGNLYAAYLAKSATTTQNSSEWQALKRKAFINNPFCQYTPLGQDPDKVQTLDICLDAPASTSVMDCKKNISDAYTALTANHLGQMQKYLSPETFKNFDRISTEVEYNYATIHLNKALGRLSKTCSITIKDQTPVTNFSGDIRDLGIIVNITNNSR